MKAIRSVNVTPAELDRETGSTAAHDRNDQPCGCGRRCTCEDECCRLECLERPKFFCGQLLTDQDLTSLVGWTQARLGLNRYIDGWGVVCGLDVHCHPDGPAVVGVSPGYAIDCCGRDIVVCEPTSKDLSKACVKSEEPCEELGSRSDQDTEPPGVFVDLSIHYMETETDPQSALARSACGQVTDCEPTRVREEHRLDFQIGVNSNSPADDEAGRWLSAWEAFREVVKPLKAQLTGRRWAKKTELDAQLVESVQSQLLKWYRTHPPQQFCILPELVCALKDEKDLAELLLLTVQDYRNALSRRECHPCSTGEGVPLARICLEADAEHHHCRIISIDPYPPYRRPLSTVSWPAPPGKVNFARALWHRADDARGILTQAGLSVRLPPKQLDPVDCVRMPDFLFQHPFIDYGSEIRLQVVGGLEGFCLGAGARVVGFESLSGREVRRTATTDDRSDFETIETEVRPMASASHIKLTAVADIGPSRSKTLHKNGIRTLAELASTSVKELKQIFPRLAEELLKQWRKDAKKLAKELQ